MDTMLASTAVQHATRLLELAEGETNLAQMAELPTG